MAEKKQGKMSGVVRGRISGPKTDVNNVPRARKPEPEPQWLLEANARRKAERDAEVAKRERVKALIAPMFANLGFEQGRDRVLSREQVIHLRKENNIQRPNGVGYLIDDLLTTCAALMAEIEAGRWGAEDVRVGDVFENDSEKADPKLFGRMTVRAVDVERFVTVTMSDGVAWAPEDLAHAGWRLVRRAGEAT